MTVQVGAALGFLIIRRVGSIPGTSTAHSRGFPAGPRKSRPARLTKQLVISQKGAWFSYARETYAIGDITMADGSERHLRSGPNAKVPVFNAVPGKVTLVGGVKVLAVGEGVSLLPDPSVTRARAARFVAGKNRREHHRENRTSARVANGKMSWVAMPDICARC